MPNDTHENIRRLLADAAADLPVLAPAPERTVRRARRHAAATFSVLAIAVGLAVGGLVTAAGPFTRSMPAHQPRTRGGVWVVDTVTGSETRIGHLPRGAFWFDVSQDASSVAFSAQSHGRSQIYLMAPDGSDVHVVTDDPYGADEPALSPDGSLVAYQGFGHEDHRNVFVVEPDGRVRQLTHERQDVAALTWSPDGNSILYSVSVPNEPAPFGFNGENMRLKQVNVATSQVTALVGGRRTAADFGTWSSDGRRIAYMTGEWLSGSYGFESAQIWLMDANGSHPHQLTALDGHALELAWAPHGNALAFSLVEGDGYGTYVIDVSTGEVRRVTSGGFPVWLDAHTLIVER
jgi:Tol biopolymer transport system component